MTQQEMTNFVAGLEARCAAKKKFEELFEQAWAVTHKPLEVTLNKGMAYCVYTLELEDYGPVTFTVDHFVEMSIRESAKRRWVDGIKGEGDVELELHAPASTFQGIMDDLRLRADANALSDSSLINGKRCTIKVSPFNKAYKLMQAESLRQLLGM